MSRIITVHPRTYNEARTIGEHFRDGVPVIMNLSEMEDVDAKRLVDFAAGLIFGLRGSIERVTSKVFLLVAAQRQRDGGGQGTHRGRVLQPELSDPAAGDVNRHGLRDSGRTHVHHRNRSSEWVLWIFLLVLFARMILSWIPVLVRDWQPRGPMLVVAEVIYSITDPPLRALRKVLKPVRIGNMMLDLAFIGLAIGVSILMQVNQAVFF